MMTKDEQAQCDSMARMDAATQPDLDMPAQPTRRRCVVQKPENGEHWTEIVTVHAAGLDRLMIDTKGVTYLMLTSGRVVLITMTELQLFRDEVALLPSMTMQIGTSKTLIGKTRKERADAVVEVHKHDDAD